MKHLLIVMIMLAIGMVCGCSESSSDVLSPDVEYVAPDSSGGGVGTSSSSDEIAESDGDMSSSSVADPSEYVYKLVIGDLCEDYGKVDEDLYEFGVCRAEELGQYDVAETLCNGLRLAPMDTQYEYSRAITTLSVVYRFEQETARNMLEKAVSCGGVFYPYEGLDKESHFVKIVAEPL